MKRLLLILIFLPLFLFSFSQSNEDILDLLIEKDVITVQDAEKWRQETTAKKENPITRLKTAFVNSDIFKLSGYGQAIYRLSDDAEVNNTFSIARVILFATGNLNPHVSYMVMYNLGPTASLLELYGQYTPVEAVNIRFGQYKVPLTLENPMSPTRLKTVYGSLSVLALTGWAQDVIGQQSGRDAGLQLSGNLFKKEDFYLLEYYMGLFNGNGMNVSDNNNHKDFAGTLIYRPLKELKLAGSVYSGKAPYILNEEPERNHVRNRWSVGGEYNSDKIYIRSEYVCGNDGGIQREGVYGVATFKLPYGLEILGKYDYYNPDKKAGTDKTTEITGGINYEFGPLSRIQLNYINTGNKLEGTTNTFATQLQLYF
jgi:hypothetical protein